MTARPLLSQSQEVGRDVWSEGLGSDLPKGRGPMLV